MTRPSLNVLVVVLLLTAACASAPTVQFHSLLPAQRAPSSSSAMTTTKVGWQLLPVAIPAQVDRPQLVVRAAADESLVVLEQERWIAPLADELHAALSERLAQRFGAPASDAPAAWRIRIDVQRFDSAPGRYARLAAAWSASTDARTLACAFESEQPVQGGFASLAEGHRRAVAALADAIAASIAAAGCRADAA